MSGRIGKEITVSRLAEIFRELEEQGAANINLVTPTHWSAHIAAALEQYRPGIPVLYNCGGYESVETVRRLAGLVDVWLPDLKYADAALGERLSGVSDYPARAIRAVEEMLKHSGNPVLGEDGMIRRGVMIRHLVLPLHLKNTFQVLRDIADRFGTDTWVSLLFQYTPVLAVPGFPELSRPLTARERERALSCLTELGFQNGYVQEAESSGTKMIPAFDQTGIAE